MSKEKSSSRVAERWANTKTAKTKNKRIFLDLRGGTLVLDFRGDSGLRALDPKKLQNMYRDFFLEVVNTEKNVGLPSTSKGHSSIEVYKDELGFHVQRWYKWFGIAEHYSNMADERLHHNHALQLHRLSSAVDNRRLGHRRFRVRLLHLHWSFVRLTITCMQLEQ